ncbi:MAG: hypothetical protein WCD76_01525, partial [Pyrinomonadaceae bacterium]
GEASQGGILREVEAVGGRAFELKDESTSDLLLVGDDTRLVETARLSSNFAWAWARFHAEGETPLEFVLVGGSQLWLDGERIIDAGASRIGYCAVRRTGDALEVETDAEEFLDIATHGARLVVINDESFALRRGVRVASFRDGALCEEMGGEERVAADVSA